MNNTRLAEKRYRDKMRKDKKGIILNNKKLKKRNKKIRKCEEDFNKYSH